MNFERQVKEETENEIAAYVAGVQGDQVALETTLLEIRGYKLGRAACSDIERKFAVVVRSSENALRRALSAKMKENADRKRNKGAPGIAQ